MTIEWAVKTFWSAEELRAAAKREDRLAKAADEDGDYGHAVMHRGKASDYREAARLKEQDNG